MNRGSPGANQPWCGSPGVALRESTRVRRSWGAALLVQINLGAALRGSPANQPWCGSPGTVVVAALPIVRPTKAIPKSGYR